MHSRLNSGTDATFYSGNENALARGYWRSGVGIDKTRRAVRLTAEEI